MAQDKNETTPGGGGGERPAGTGDGGEIAEPIIVTLDHDMNVFPRLRDAEAFIASFRPAGIKIHDASGQICEAEIAGGKARLRRTNVNDAAELLESIKRLLFGYTLFREALETLDLPAAVLALMRFKS